jgi:hypothetical protein
MTNSIEHSEYDGEGTLVSIGEYRRILHDTRSTDEEILRRLQYLQSLCRSVIRNELENYANKTT